MTTSVDPGKDANHASGEPVEIVELGLDQDDMLVCGGAELP